MAYGFLATTFPSCQTYIGVSYILDVFLACRDAARRACATDSENCFRSRSPSALFMALPRSIGDSLLNCHIHTTNRQAVGTETGSWSNSAGTGAAHLIWTPLCPPCRTLAAIRRSAIWAEHCSRGQSGNSLHETPEPKRQHRLVVVGIL